MSGGLPKSRHVLFNRVSYDGTLVVRKSHRINSPDNSADFGKTATTSLNFGMVRDSEELRKSLYDLKKQRLRNTHRASIAEENSTLYEQTPRNVLDAEDMVSQEFYSTREHLLQPKIQNNIFMQAGSKLKPVKLGEIITTAKAEAKKIMLNNASTRGEFRLMTEQSQIRYLPR